MRGHHFEQRKAFAMSDPTNSQILWSSAELLIAFHKTRARVKRATPFLWRPQGAMVRLLAKPADQEAFVLMKGTDGCADLQIKLHPDKVVIRRDQVLGWSGIILDDQVVRVQVDDAWIKIGPDGAVAVTRDADTTYLEGDGSIIRISPDAEIVVSGDGGQISRRTPDQIEALTATGFVSRRRGQQADAALAE
jgi:hypothetical protein